MGAAIAEVQVLISGDGSVISLGLVIVLSCCRSTEISLEWAFPSL
jgi:hypothetical protein